MPLMVTPTQLNFTLSKTLGRPPDRDSPGSSGATPRDPAPVASHDGTHGSSHDVSSGHVTSQVPSIVTTLRMGEIHLDASPAQCAPLLHPAPPHVRHVIALPCTASPLPPSA